MCQLFFHEESKYEISKPWHAQFKTYAMHQKVCNVKMPQMTRGHNSRNTFQNLFKSSSGHLLIATNLFLKFQGSSFNSF